MPDQKAKFLFEPVPHTEAAKLIKDKPAVGRSVFDQMLPEIKARAFTIAGTEGIANVLQAARDQIADLLQGGDWNKIKHDIANEISPFIDDVTKTEAENLAAAEARAELLLRTHGFQAYSACNERVIEAQKDVFPFCEYVTVGDDRVRASHAALDGKIVPTNSPFWKTHTPPWGWGCRCQKVPRTAADVGMIQNQEKKLAPENQSVFTGARLTRLENGHLELGPSQSLNVAPPTGDHAFVCTPGNLRIPLENLEGQYRDADGATTPAWNEFKAFATRTQIPELGKSIWTWLSETSPAASSPTAAVTPAVPEAAEVVVVATAVGTPVSNATRVELTGIRAAAARTTLQAINEVHGDGDLAPLPIKPVRSSKYAAAYRRTEISNQPVDILVSSSGQTHELNLAHEVGHWLDHQTLGDRGSFASEKHPDLTSWRQAIENSSPVKALRETLKRGTLLTQAGKKTVEIKLSGAELSQIRNYFLAPRELFARSYAQFIAEKSGNALMQSQTRLYTGPEQRWQQWLTEDFSEIKTELEKLFQKKGWMK